ncbi:MAG: FHA domain-containing protein [Cyanobacteria bacterium P01_F01_bin.42]
MNELTLEWSENGQTHRHSFQNHQLTKQPGVYRIGRDPARCDLVLRDRSVSALHVEIFLNHPQKLVQIRNLRASNPPLVDGRQLITGESPLHQGSRISLGRVEMIITSLQFPVAQSPVQNPAQGSAQSSAEDYGLKCPNPSCGKVSAYDSVVLLQGCPWCGFSLAAADSVVICSHDA